MKSSKLILPITLAIALVSCSKKEELPECPGSCTVVTGRLLTSGSAPLSNAVVTLQWMGGSGSFGPSSHKKAVSRTDNDGRYRVSGFFSDAEIADGYIEVVFSPDKSKYYLIGEPEVAFHQPKRDTIYSAPDFLIPRKAFIKLGITNPNQLPGPYSYSSDFNSCYGGNTVFSRSIRGGGAYVNWSGLPSQNPMEIAGDQPIIVRHYKNGTLVAPIDSIFIPAGTTKTYMVTY